MNPFDAVGTARVSQAIADRMCRVVLGYQDDAGERAITSSVSGLSGRWVDLSVALTRATREHPDVRMGSSVRGAIDLALVLTGLAALRGEADPGRDTGRDAAYAALSGRIRVADGVDRTPGVGDRRAARPAVARRPREASGGTGRPAGKADSPPGSPRRASSPAPGPVGTAASRTHSRQQLAQQHPAFDEVSPEVGELDEEAFDAAVAEDPDAAAAMLADLAVATDVALRAAARRLAGPGVPPARPGRADQGAGHPAARAVPRARRRPRPRPHPRRLDAERLAAARVEDLVTRTLDGAPPGRVPARRHLRVDAGARGGDGRGGRGGRDRRERGGREKLQPSVLTFAPGSKVLQAQGARRPPEELLSELVALRGHGTTDLAAALRDASIQLASAVADERMVVLLSDCLHTAGDDPADGARGHRPAARARPPRRGGGRGGGGSPGRARRGARTDRAAAGRGRSGTDPDPRLRTYQAGSSAAPSLQGTGVRSAP